MMRYLGVLLLPCAALAADASRGAVVYRNSCGVAYCHGPEGKPGRAPGFVGRRLAREAVIQTVTNGIPHTAMPAFEKLLKTEDIDAVAAYLVSLGGPNAAASDASAPRKLPPEIEQGRVLFFDPGRMGSCGYCHEVAGRGANVSLALQDLRAAKLDLKSVQTPEVVTARPAGEDAFPALVAEKTVARIRVYDLSPRLPVLRTFLPTEVTITPGSSWRHDTATGLYTSTELGAIDRYLRWMQSGTIGKP